MVGAPPSKDVTKLRTSRTVNEFAKATSLETGGTRCEDANSIPTFVISSEAWWRSRWRRRRSATSRFSLPRPASRPRRARGNGRNFGATTPGGCLVARSRTPETNNYRRRSPRSWSWVTCGERGKNGGGRGRRRPRDLRWRRQNRQPAGRTLLPRFYSRVELQGCLPSTDGV